MSILLIILFNWFQENFRKILNYDHIILLKTFFKLIELYESYQLSHKLQNLLKSRRNSNSHKGATIREIAQLLRWKWKIFPFLDISQYFNWKLKKLNVTHLPTGQIPPNRVGNLEWIKTKFSFNIHQRFNHKNYNRYDTSNLIKTVMESSL